MSLYIYVNLRKVDLMHVFGGGGLIFRFVSAFTHSLTPLRYLETTRLEKSLRFLAARLQTDEYDTNFDEFTNFHSLPLT